MARRSTAIALILAASLAPASQALAWGSTGHRIIGQLGVATLPDQLPGFLRSPEAVTAIGELAREPDRWRKAGEPHDHMRDPGHFLDLDDSGKVLGGPALNALPTQFNDYETALRAAGSDSSKAGWLPYSIVDGWQQLAKDFTYWRIESVAAARETNPARKAWLAEDLKIREALTIRDLGVWAHYVGDASQPMHVTVHYNGWGAFPNPNGYTNQHVHGPFEGAFVRQFVTEDAVRAAMPAPRDCAEIWACTERYLGETSATVVPFYEMEKAGGMTGAHPAGVGFTVQRVAAGAAALRDMIVAAWQASANGSLGYPAITVDQVVNGGVDPYDALYGDD